MLCFSLNAGRRLDLGMKAISAPGGAPDGPLDRDAACEALGAV